ncbi:MAG: LuxR C-terminal-related transcriptional regulator [Actinomycetota bacterium]
MATLTVTAAPAWPLVGRERVVSRVLGLLTGGVPAVVLAGPPGIGRSRVLAVCAERAAEAGFRVVTGWPAADAPPGALVVVDDLERVDDDARALVDAVAAGRLRHLGALRSGTPPPEAVTRAWRDGDWERVDLEPLDRADVAELAAHAAGLPVDGVSVERLANWTGGVPAELIAVLEATVEREWFRDRGAVATLQPGFPLVAALPPSVRTRLEGAPPDVLVAAEIVAVGGRVSDAVLTRVVGADTTTAADERGLVEADHDGGELAWRPGTPLLGEHVRATLTAEQTRVRRAQLAAVLDRDDVRTPDALLVRGEACRERGSRTPDDLALLVDAAEVALARNDISLAVGLARAAWEDGRVTAAALVLGSALELVGDIEGRARVAQDACSQAGDDRERVIATEQLATALTNLDRVPDARQAVENARRVVADPLWAARLDALAANIHLHAARLKDAIAAAQPYLGVALAAPDAATLVGVALAVGGRTDQALETTAVGAAALGAVMGEPRTVTPALVHVVTGIAHMEAGDFDAADAAVLPVYEESVARGDRTVQAWAALALGRTALLRGAVRSAVRWFRDAVAGFAEQGMHGYLAWAYSGLAGAAALAGDRDAARAAADAFSRVPTHPVRLYEPDSQRLLAWVDVADDRLQAASQSLEDAAAAARASGQFVLEAGCLHDLARLGDARRALDLLSDNARACDGALVPLRVAHIEAIARADVDAIERAAEGFEHIEAWLLAAEAWAGRAGMRSQPRETARAARRAHAAAARCERARPPMLRAVPRPELTDRVREVAVLAAAGVARVRIAERLYLSARTVDRHIEDVYRRLGVRSRDELPAALADLVRTEEGIAPPPSDPGESWPFVGRDDELAALRAGIDAGEISGIALVGPAGMGKTQLARQLGRELAGQGWPVEHVDGDAPALEVGEAAARANEGMDRGLLLVDDAHLLDDEAAGALERVFAAGEPVVVLTVRTDDPRGRRPPGAWTRPELLTLTLGPLDADDVAHLLARALHGPVLRGVVDALTVASEGNPLWLRELVRAALVEGRLRERDGAWDLTETGGPSPRLDDLVEARLAPLDAETRRALAGLAVAEPLPASVAEHVIDEAVLARLERNGLVERDETSAARLAHRLYGDALRARLSETARRAWYARLVDAAEAGGVSAVEITRVLRWRVEADRPVPGEFAAAAADRALTLGDLDGADRLARHALTGGASPAVHLVLARVAEAHGDPAAAEAAYQEAGGSADPVARARAALGAAELLTWSTSDVGRGRALLEAGLDARPSDPWPEVLHAASGLLPALAGRAFECDPDADVSSPVPEVAVRRSIARAAVLLTAGPSDRAVEETERARQLAARAGTPVLTALLVEVRAMAVMADGRMDDARRDRAPSPGRRPRCRRPDRPQRRRPRRRPARARPGTPGRGHRLLPRRARRSAPAPRRTAVAGRPGRAGARARDGG